MSTPVHMDKERILNLAYVVEEEKFVSIPGAYDAKDGFNMDYFFHKCGTPCCLAGYTIDLYDNVDGRKIILGVVVERAARLLGIKFADAQLMFNPSDVSADICWHKISPQRAAAMLRNYVETGEVDWTLKVKGERVPWAR